MRVLSYLVEHEHSSTEGEGLAEIMGDHYHGHATLGPELFQQRVGGLLVPRVEGPKGLVQKEQLRLQGQGLGEG